MAATANRRLGELVVAPGPEGVRAVHAALLEALDDRGPAVALVPPDDGSLHVSRQRACLHLDAELESPEVAAILSTSGSTGDPVGVLLTGSALRAAAAATHAVLERGPGRWVVAMPVTAVGGLMTVVRAVDSGIAPVAWEGVGGAAPFTPESFVPTAHSALAASRADGAPTYVSLVPTQLSRLCDDSSARDVLAQFDHVLIGAAALPRPLRDRAAASGVRLTSTYGASETCGGVVYDGVPLPGVAVRTGTGVREGLVSIGGVTLAEGYRCRPDLTESAFVDGWYLTADVGAVEDGVLSVLGRADDVVKVGGRKVALLAVAEAARSVEGVSDAAATSVPDAEWGELPVLFVVGDASETALRDAVERFLGRTRLAVRWVESLPYLPNGKIDRMSLQALARESTVD